MNDGGITIDANDDQDKRRRVHRERLHEHDEFAHGIPRQPGHRTEPHHIGRDVDEGDEEIGDGEVENEEVDAGFSTSLSPHGEENDEIERHRENQDGGEGNDSYQIGQLESWCFRYAGIGIRRFREI